MWIYLRTIPLSYRTASLPATILVNFLNECYIHIDEHSLCNVYVKLDCIEPRQWELCDITDEEVNDILISYNVALDY